MTFALLRADGRLTEGSADLNRTKRDRRYARDLLGPSRLAPSIGRCLLTVNGLADGDGAGARIAGVPVAYCGPCGYLPGSEDREVLR